VVRRVLAVLLIVFGATLALGALLRWSATERALRNRRPLPPPGMSIYLVAGLVGICLVLAASLVVRWA
jgi:putative membrane protein